LCSAYTFSDSFWYNAVEASLCNGLTFNAHYFGLKWEQEMNTPRGNKWLLIISLVVGLSFGTLWH
jgi:hypothetical protein